MTKEELIQLLREKPDAMRALNGDGHGLYAPEWYTEVGWPSEMISRLNVVHTSDGTTKGSMWDHEGNIIAEQRAVYSLDFHEAVASIVGTTAHHSMFGRGSAARAIAIEVRAIVEVGA
jgi:hypothetical protein